MSKRIFAFLLFVACILPLNLNRTLAQAAKAPSDEKDVLIFNNGDQLTGKFERSTGANVTFKSDMAGEITVGWDKIKELHASGRYAVLQKGFKEQGSRKINNARIPQGTLTVEHQTIAVKQDAGPPVEVPTKDSEFILDNTTYEKDLRGQPGFLADWNGAVTAGATLVRATQNSETFTGAVNLVRTAPNVTWLDPRSRDLVDFADTYGKVTQTGVADVKTSIFHADAEHDIYFSPRAYGLASVAFDHNYSQGLNLQQIYGGGIGLTVFKKPTTELDIKAQAQYETQSYGAVPPATTSATPNTNLFGATFAENYMRKFKTIVFTQQLELIPAFNVLQDYSAVGQAGVVFPVYKRLSFTANATDNFLNDPAPGAVKNSFQFVTGITYKLR
jgi:hypothetical protein